MIPNLPTLGARFDIGKIDSAAYGLECWRIFWRAIDPEEMAGAQLYEGDTAATLAGKEKVYCIGIQSAKPSVLAVVRSALEGNEGFVRVAGSPALVEGGLGASEPLVMAGKVDHAGNLVGESPRARPALGEVRRERSGETVGEAPVEPIPTRTRPASPRTGSLPELTSIKELKEFLKENLNPEPEKARGELFWITPEELCDIVERYADFVQAQWGTRSMPFTEEVIEIRLFNKKQFESSGLFLWGMFSFPSEADARAYCYDKKRHLDYMIGRLEELMHIKGKISLNFTGMASKTYPESYEDDKKSEKNVSPEELWRMILTRRRELGLPPPLQVEGDRVVSPKKHWWQFRK
ncbi:MAG: hypothetical protein ACXACI_16540 [Candidatus Hodarchaeales archaeon]|jgi:hypothetical protein